MGTDSVPQVERVEASPGSPETCAARTVVIADDNDGVRAMVADVATDLSLVVAAVVSDAAQAIAAWSEHTPDLMVVDLDMPGGGGWEVIRRVRASGSATEIVVFSGVADGHDRDEVLVLGADRFVSKAAPLVELEEAIRGSRSCT